MDAEELIKHAETLAHRVEHSQTYGDIAAGQEFLRKYAGPQSQFFVQARGKVNYTGVPQAVSSTLRLALLSPAVTSTA